MEQKPNPPVDRSAAMALYRTAVAAILGHQDPTEAIEAVSELPIEKRYIWRIVSALHVAFDDYDSICVQIDRETLTEEQRAQIAKLLEARPTQFCLMLAAFLGVERMERIMRDAVSLAKEQAA
jgi:hypothetical protein